jgi:hypothetical protein
MKVVLDGVVEFEQEELRVGSWRRDVIERAAAGVDGVVSIDAGRRTREIVQKGVMRAASDEALRSRIDSISALMDGGTHTLKTAEGQEFDNLRIDAFEVGQKDYSGRGASCGFEIRYVQF